MSQSLSGAEFKKQLREGKPKMGLFINSHSPTVVEQLAFSGYDWLLGRHASMDRWATKPFRECSREFPMAARYRWYASAGIRDRPGIQQALDMGANGVLCPYINTADEARQVCKLLPVPYGGNSIRVFSSAQYEREGPAGLRRRCER